jgi:hypothetical protein
MQIALIGAAYGLIFFVVLYLGFRAGLRLGMQTAKGQIPPKIAPVKAVKDALAKPDPATVELLKGHANMMAYDGFLPEEKQPEKR